MARCAVVVIHRALVGARRRCGERLSELVQSFVVLLLAKERIAGLFACLSCFKLSLQRRKH
jgi:hypothetical protein